MGGQKRVGGQGDILTGAIATFLAWGKAYNDNIWEYAFAFFFFFLNVVGLFSPILRCRHSKAIDKADIPMLASWGASRITRECSRAAFQKHGRAMLTSDMAAEVGP